MACFKRARTISNDSPPASIVSALMAKVYQKVAQAKTIRKDVTLWDEFHGLHHISWHSYRFLSLPRVAKLRAISTSWKQAFEHYLSAGYLLLDVQKELLALEVKIGIPSLWRGMEEGQVLNAEDEPKIQALVNFVSTKCRKLKTLRLLYGMEPWMIYKLQPSVHDMVMLEIFLEEGRYDVKTSLAPWVASSWQNLRSLVLISFFQPDHYVLLLRAIKDHCRSLRHAHIRCELEPAATMTRFPVGSAALLGSLLQLSSLNSLEMAFSAPKNLTAPDHVMAPLKSLQLGGPRTRVCAFRWPEYMCNILPRVPLLKFLGISCMEISPRLAELICHSHHLEGILLDACAKEKNLILLLAEFQDDGDVRWLPKLKKFQIQEGDEEIRRHEIPGWHGMSKRQGLQVMPERFQIEYLEDYDDSYKEFLWQQVHGC